MFSFSSRNSSSSDSSTTSLSSPPTQLQQSFHHTNNIETSNVKTKAKVTFTSDIKGCFNYLFWGCLNTGKNSTHLFCQYTARSIMCCVYPACCFTINGEGVNQLVELSSSQDKKAIGMSSHTSNFDGFAIEQGTYLARILRNPCSIFDFRQIFTFPGKNALNIKLLALFFGEKFIIFDRSKSNERKIALQEMLNVTNNGHTVIVFPNGFRATQEINQTVLSFFKPKDLNSKYENYNSLLKIKKTVDISHKAYNDIISGKKMAIFDLSMGSIKATINKKIPIFPIVVTYSNIVSTEMSVGAPVSYSQNQFDNDPTKNAKMAALDLKSKLYNLAGSDKAVSVPIYVRQTKTEIIVIPSAGEKFQISRGEKNKNI